MGKATKFVRHVRLPAPVETAFQWHEQPGALERLIPPWESVEVIRRADNIATGASLELVNRIGPFQLRWLAEHIDYQPNRMFRDVQRRGPFAMWDHQHLFAPDAAGQCVLTDRVAYCIPGGPLGRLLGARFIGAKIERMFAYRHDITAADLAFHNRYAERPRMHVAVSGARGLVGANLCPLLTTGGHRVTRLVRKSRMTPPAVAGGLGVAASTPDSEFLLWDPQDECWDASPWDGIDAVIHLAGENLAARRWTAEQKRRIRDGRASATRNLCRALAKMGTPPKVFVAASTIGFYGNRGAEDLDESSSAGQGFLAESAREWEEATAPARDAGIRVVHLRLGMVLSPRGGALAAMLLPFKWGLGGRLGSGRQSWSWVAVDDVAGAIAHAALTPAVAGPVNVVAPSPATNREFANTLGAVLRRWSGLPRPAAALRLALGERADALWLSSAKVRPGVLQRTGYQFRLPRLRGALEHLLGRHPASAAPVATANDRIPSNGSF